MSDIFDEYAKLAISSGLIKVAKEDAKKPERKRNPDFDDAIRLLYGIEPDTIYKEPLIDEAHPETYIAGRAYDSMNAVVENLRQRQSVMTAITLNTPTGNVTGHRYVSARKDLINSLVKTAFELDSKEEKELMVLADSCSEKIVKEAGVIIPVLIAAGVATGLFHWLGRSGATAQNVKANSEKVLEELTDLSNKTFAQEILNYVSKIAVRAEQAYEFKSKLYNSIKSANDISVIKSAISSLELYIKELNVVLSKIPVWVERVELDKASEQTGSESDWWIKIKQVADYVYDNDHEDLINELQGKGFAGTSITSAQGGLKGAIINEIKTTKQFIATAERAIYEFEHKDELIEEKEEAIAAAPIKQNKTEDEKLQEFISSLDE